MTASDRIDALTKTFSTDESFCNAIFASDYAERAAEVLVLKKWAAYYIPHFQTSLDRIGQKHFEQRHRKTAKFWTVGLTGLIMKDINLMSYLMIRGQAPAGGAVLRRAFEHVGVLTHIWYNQKTVAALEDTHSREYIHAFQSDPDQKVRLELKSQGIKKRFEKCLTGAALSPLYGSLSEFDVHGGRMSNIWRSSKEATALTNRIEISELHFAFFLPGCQMLCMEIAGILDEYGRKYQKMSADTRKGLAYLGEILTPDGRPSVVMKDQTSEMLREFHPKAQPSVTVAGQLDRLTRTFSADRLFCDSLFASERARTVAEILVYDHWAKNFLPHLQAGMLAMVPSHFSQENADSAYVWTEMLTKSVIRDISLVSYLMLRGFISEAGSTLRRAFEHAGVLTHLWYEPIKIVAVNDHESGQFEAAFERETDKKRREELTKLGILKRFENFGLFAQLASQMYGVLSQFDVHGGTLANLVDFSIMPNEYSCGFTNRNSITENLDVLAHGCALLCEEVALIHGRFGKKYGVTPAVVGEAGRFLSELVSSPGTESSVMRIQIDKFLDSILTDTVTGGSAESK